MLQFWEQIFFTFWWMMVGEILTLLKTGRVCHGQDFTLGIYFLKPMTFKLMANKKCFENMCNSYAKSELYVPKARKPCNWVLKFRLASEVLTSICHCFVKDLLKYLLNICVVSSMSAVVICSSVCILNCFG